MPQWPRLPQGHRLTPVATSTSPAAMQYFSPNWWVDSRRAPLRPARGTNSLHFSAAPKPGTRSIRERGRHAAAAVDQAQRHQASTADLLRGRRIAALDHLHQRRQPPLARTRADRESLFGRRWEEASAASSAVDGECVVRDGGVLGVAVVALAVRTSSRSRRPRAAAGRDSPNTTALAGAAMITRIGDAKPRLGARNRDRAHRSASGPPFRYAPEPKSTFSLGDRGVGHRADSSRAAGPF